MKTSTIYYQNSRFLFVIISALFSPKAEQNSTFQGPNLLGLFQVPSPISLCSRRRFKRCLKCDAYAVDVWAQTEKSTSFSHGEMPTTKRFHYSGRRGNLRTETHVRNDILQAFSLELARLSQHYDSRKECKACATTAHTSKRTNQPARPNFYQWARREYVCARLLHTITKVFSLW